MLALNSLYNMDCMEGMALLGEECIDLTVTSPPYDNLREYHGYAFDADAVIKQLFRVTKQGGVVVWIVNDQMINGSETGTSFRQALKFMESGFKLHDTMIWQKISPFQHPNRYIQQFEYMFIFSKKAPKTANLICDRHNTYAGRQIHGTERQRDGTTRILSSAQKGKSVKEYGARYNVWDIPAEKHNTTNHPAVFPLPLVTDHIRTWSVERDTIMDPFSGTGTTAIAAHMAGRNFIGFEIDKDYWQAATARLEAHKAQQSLFLEVTND
jgi:DNA modification methylase